jgi:hypothetical protein
MKTAKISLKRHACLKDASESSRKRSLFEHLKTGKDALYEVRKAPDGGLFSGRADDFCDVAWPLVTGHENGCLAEY